jgi:hypothetical protein
MARETETGSHKASSRTVRARSLSEHSRARVAVVAGIMSAGVLTGVAGLGVGASSAARSTGSPPALAARTISLRETGHLRRTSSSGLKLNEQGSASGTIKGSIYIHLNVVSPSRVTAEVNIYPRGGSLTGSSSASYRVNGGTANFSGKLSIKRGTGTYSHAHGSGLSFSGTIQRLSGAVTVHLSGNMST